MRPSHLIKRSLCYYWRTNLAVVFGVTTAVSVLGGALLVGDSVRASLRDLFLRRLGKTEMVISGSHYFPESLASRIGRRPEFRGQYGDPCPIIVTQAVVTHQESGRRASEVQIYGVDERFWRFHGQSENLPSGFGQRDALISHSLAEEIGTHQGDSILLRVEAPSEIPAESLHGRKEGLGRSIRLNTRQILAEGGLGEFSLLPQQGPVHTVFVPLKRLQGELTREGQVNTLLISAHDSFTRDSEGTAPPALTLAETLKAAIALDDLGIRVRLLEKQRCLSLERSSTLLDDSLVAKASGVASRLGLRPFPILTYLANHIRTGERQTPYSLVTAVDEGQFAEWSAGQIQSVLHPRKGDSGKPPVASSLESPPPIWLNEWAARDLNAQAGDPITLDYYVWEEEGRLVTRTAAFRLRGVLPIEGLAADRDLAPEYPGISDSDTLSDWDPPFPMNLGWIRPKDEDYWKQYRTTPKAFVLLDEGRKLWKSRFGSLTSLRLLPGQASPAASMPEDLASTLNRFHTELLGAINPLELGFALVPVRAQGLAASQGATDFGEYFAYFSFFLVASALLLSALLFRLGVEQRLREIGLLKAVGFAASQIRSLFLTEGLLLAGLGSLAGLFGAFLYGKLMMFGLRTWWVGAVGTSHLLLHLSPASLFLGAIGGFLSSLACIAWTLHRLAPAPPRGLLSGSWLSGTRTQGAGRDQMGLPGPRPFFLSVLRLSPLQASMAAASFGAVLLAASALQRMGQVAGFFGAGTLFLIALLALQGHWLRRRGRNLAGRWGGWAIAALGFRNATHRPGRSILCISLIAFAAFIIVAVESFRRDGHSTSSSPQSGTGGFALFAQSLLPLLHDPDTKEGREALNLDASDNPLLDSLKVFRFRVRQGEDTSCLNLYEPRSPRILAPTNAFLELGRFSFQGSLAASEAEQRNPWLLLHRKFPDGAIPVIGDANSLTYVLHLKLGQDWLIHRGGAEPVRVRVVGALADSLFQRELLMSEAHFKRLFPEVPGYRFFLLDVPRARQAETSQFLEERLADYGFDVLSSQAQLASFHRVENTYLSTFQALGGLGLLLGTLGLAIVLLRNILERRRELALLQVVGYRPWHLSLMILAETAQLLVCGLATGTLCALLAIAPALSARGSLPAFSLGSLLLAVLLAGLGSSVLATRAALRARLIEALRAE